MCERIGSLSRFLFARNCCSDKHKNQDNQQAPKEKSNPETDGELLQLPPENKSYGSMK